MTHQYGKKTLDNIILQSIIACFRDIGLLASDSTLGPPSEQREMADERREGGDGNAHLQNRTEARHILAVLRYPHRRPTQTPTLPGSRTSFMQSIVRPRKITRNQPSAIGPHSCKPPERTTAESRRPISAREC